MALFASSFVTMSLSSSKYLLPNNQLGNHSARYGYKETRLSDSVDHSVPANALHELMGRSVQLKEAS